MRDLNCKSLYLEDDGSEVNARENSYSFKVNDRDSTLKSREFVDCKRLREHLCEIIIQIWIWLNFERAENSKGLTLGV